MIRQRIEEAIRAAVGGGVKFVVERPRSLEHGDYATNAALVAKINPEELAGKLKIEGVEKIEVKGAFVNFYLSRAALVPKEEKIPQLNAGKTIMVEYTDPNPFKEFHIGHLMSNTIGEAIARLLELTGAKVLRANYQGDVGPHVAKAIWGKMQKPELPWGAAYTYGSTEYEAHKAEIDALNKKIYERSDTEINRLYDDGRKESLELFEGLYRLLGTKFDRDYYFFESQTAPVGLELVQKHPELFKKSEGAVIYNGAHTRVFVTSKGLPTYEAKDLGLLQAKKQKGHLDQSITITANEQNDYFDVVLEVALKIAEIADIAAKTKHVSHGIMRFESGKMSSRTGNVISGASLIEDMTQKSEEKSVSRKEFRTVQTKLRDAREESKKNLFNLFGLISFGKAEDKNKLKFKNQDTRAVSFTRQVGIGAIKYTVLKQASNKDIIFDPEKSLSLEGDSGPYLQYARVRAASLLRKASTAREVDYREAKYDQDFEEFGLGYRLMRILVHYPEVVERAAKELEPHYLTTYLTELASTFNSWYGTQRIIVDGKIGSGRVNLIKAVERTLREGLETLGIPVPEEM